MLVDPYDTRKPLEPRVRSWLHVNCSVCHVNEGGGNANIDLAFGRGTRGMGLVNGEPVHDRFEIPDAKLITPGSPEKSVLYQRVSRRGTGQMPPLVSTEVDKSMTKLIAEWIRNIPKEAK